MSRSADDESLTNFLNAYKKHPCLWNPYHKRYYECTAKNEALRRIVSELGIPGYTVADYLRQIKAIREKYREEQVRTINGLQSQVPYKSAYRWYEIVAGMLKRVINDEEKVNKRTTPERNPRTDETALKSLNNDDAQLMNRSKKRLLDTKHRISICCNEIRNNVEKKKTKSVEKIYPYFPRFRIAKKQGRNENKYSLPVERVRCPSQKTIENSSKFSGERLLPSNYEPTRDVGPESPEKSALLPRALPERRSSKLKRENTKGHGELLHCPSCGWEETEYAKLEMNFERDFNDRTNVASQRDTVICPSYKSSFNKDNETCVSRTTENRFDNDAGDFESENLPKEVLCPRMRSNFNEMVKSCCYRGATIKVIDEKKSTDEGVQCKQIEITMPNDVTHYKATNENTLDFSPDVENNYQNGILVASTQFKIILPNSDDQGQTNSLGCVKKTIFPAESYNPKSKATQANLTTANLSERETQITVCTLNRATSQPNVKCSVSLQTLPKVDVKSCEDTKNGHCVKQPSFPSELKDVGVNTFQQVDQKIQSTLSVFCGNSARCSPPEETEEANAVCVRNSGNAMAVDFKSLGKVETDFTLLTRDGKFIPLVRVTSENVAKCATKIARQFDNPWTTVTCPQINDVAREDSNLVQILQEFLQRISPSKSERETQTEESFLSQNSYLHTNNEYKCNVKGNCTIDMTDVISKIKECASKLLNSDLDANHPKDQFSRGFRSKCNESPMCSERIDARPNTNGFKTSFVDVHEISTIHEGTGINLMSEPPRAEDKATQQINEDETAVPETGTEEISLEDKSVATYLEYRDVGTDRSLSKLSARDVETQHATRSLNDSVSSAEHARRTRKRISVGTQKRDPIIVRVIKCADEQRRVDGNAATCRRENSALRDMYRKRSISHYGSTTKYLRPVSGDVRNFPTGQDDCLKRWTTSTYYECDKGCKDRGLFKGDWTDITKAL